MGDEDQIRKLLEDWTQAVRDGSMEGVLAHHADDIVMFDVPEPLQSRGIDAYRKTWELFFNYGSAGPESFQIVELHVEAGETLAFAHGILGIMDSRLRLTVGLRKERGEWIVAHEHHSYPAKVGD